MADQRLADAKRRLADAEVESRALGDDYVARSGVWARAARSLVAYAKELERERDRLRDLAKGYEDRLLHYEDQE